MYNVRLYQSTDFNAWNTFVANAKNATFLFHRNFMEYHKDRFEDYSLMVFKSNKLIAIIPANKKGNEVFSHQGLTYGGIILNNTSKFKTVKDIYESIIYFLKIKKIKKIYFKLIPNIYCDHLNDEIKYLLFSSGAKIKNMNTFSALPLENKLKWSQNRVEGYKRGLKCNLKIKEDNNLIDFWEKILIPNLKLKHNTVPVHSISEIEFLKKEFSNNIRQFNVYDNDKLIAGTTIFETKNVAHSQYISANTDKNSSGSLDFLHHHLLKNIFKEKKYFDFGASNKENGSYVDFGLNYWKEGFGARTQVQFLYELKLKNYKPLNDLFI